MIFAVKLSLELLLTVFVCVISQGEREREEVRQTEKKRDRKRS